MISANSTTFRTEEGDLLRAEGIVKHFPVSRSLTGRVLSQVHAVDNVTLSVKPGETLGIVGESGSGKSTVGRIMARLLKQDTGEVLLEGQTLTRSRREEIAFRSDVQMVLQDPFSSLDPTKTIRHAVEEPLIVRKFGSKAENRKRATEMLEKVGLSGRYLNRYPADLSGGQRQRVCIARSLVLSPKVVVADEPTSALDLSTRAEILNLLLQLQRDLGIAIVLISHDFATIRHISHRIAVMYLGRIVEEGPVAAIADDPKHPYTQALISAVPSINALTNGAKRKRIRLGGSPPNPIDRPSGCFFHTRCPFATEFCKMSDPELAPEGSRKERRVACHLAHQPEKMAASFPLVNEDSQ